MHDESTPEGRVGIGRFDRRSVLGAIGVGAGVAWVAPVVLTAPAGAAASVPECGTCVAPDLVNPGAETGDVTGWTGTAAAHVWPFYANVTPQPGSGSYLFLFQQSQDLSQAVGIPQDCGSGTHSYTLGFDYLVSHFPVGPGAMTLEVELAAGPTVLQTDVFDLPTAVLDNPGPGLPFVPTPTSRSGTIPSGADSLTVRITSHAAAPAVVDRFTLSFC